VDRPPAGRLGTAGAGWQRPPADGPAPLRSALAPRPLPLGPGAPSPLFRPGLTASTPAVAEGGGGRPPGALPPSPSRAQSTRSRGGACGPSGRLRPPGRAASTPRRRRRASEASPRPRPKFGSTLTPEVAEPQLQQLQSRAANAPGGRHMFGGHQLETASSAHTSTRSPTFQTQLDSNRSRGRHVHRRTSRRQQTTAGVMPFRLHFPPTAGARPPKSFKHHRTRWRRGALVLSAHADWR
jgi:hypothetical protein